ncbi:MCE family protein [Mycobacterium terramassiliense]|uniref:ABC-type transporter Mla maintaining outer membrane lipid asymmetry, periplasmic component MlaD n=1 Tax=Mycobacterium terramassiliense TaxID=1841859 RepID=A0A2U3NGF5_9MYCO|nr:MCE family protein [Mycobacterium terramassiliense]SPM30599.1 ABC-type transporter Mla maintaining outer membrane lipid asymmetry, periplasmic component MlaD [Mycobacterium terramassiliense]
MINVMRQRVGALCGCILVMSSAGCGFSGLNSLPLPGTVGHGAGSTLYHAELPDVGTLEPNSPVMIGDVVVGSITKMTVTDWHADVEFSIKPDAIVPANAEATIGQTSLLGSMHLALDPPAQQRPEGRLQPGATIGLNRSSIYPSTEQTLASVSSLINGGGVAHFGDIVHNLNAALNGHEDQFRDMLARLDDFLGILDRQRGKAVSMLNGLNRLSATLAANNKIIDRALNKVPAALDILNRELPNFTTALDKLGLFSKLATRLVADSGSDLVTNLQNLAPTVQALADVGPELADALVEITTWPYTQNFIDRAIRGDYMNLFITMDLTVPRLKGNLMLGTRWGQPGAELVPAPGDFWNYSHDPLASPFAGPPLAPPNATPPPPSTPGTLQGALDPGLGPVAPTDLPGSGG